MRDGIEFKAGADAAYDERQQFLQLVLKGGEAEATPERIARARWLVFDWEHGSLVGVAAIKSPSPAYRTRLAKYSDVQLEDWTKEVGYIFLERRFRGDGRGRRLFEAAMQRVEGADVWASARPDNPGMLRLLESGTFRFQRAGAYPSNRGNYELVLYVRPGLNRRGN